MNSASEILEKRIGFTIEKGAPAREGALIYAEDSSEPIGRVTSGSFSPVLKKPIGMGYVNSQYDKVNHLS